MTRSQRRLAIVVAVVGFVGWFLYQLFGPNPKLVVSKETTWLTEPLADDGLPDYAKWYLDRQREGVTPENNAAIPFLQAMWPANFSPEEQEVICAEIGMEIPKQDGMTSPMLDPALQRALMLELLARHGIEPPSEIKSQDEFEEWRLDWEQSQMIDGGADDGSPWTVAPFDTAEETVALILQQCCDRPWNSEDFVALVNWIETHNDNFQLLREAGIRPKYYVPSPVLITDPTISFLAMQLHDVQVIREATRAIATRAMMHTGTGDFAKAWQDCQLIYALSDRSRDDTLIGQLVVIALSTQANKAVGAILEQPELPGDVALSIHEFLLTRAFRNEVANVLNESERLIAITSLMELFGPRQRDDSFGLVGSADGDRFLAGLASARIDWNYVLRSLNARYDQLSKAASETDPIRRRERLNDFDEQIKLLEGPITDGTLIVKGLVSPEARSKFVADVFAALLFPATWAARSAEDRHNADVQLMQIAAALAVHRIEHGSYPESLDALVPELLEVLPTDNDNGKPLVYHKTDDGYLLYNRGPNGEDDGGSSGMYSTLEGYEVTHENEARVCKLLGLSRDNEESLLDQIPYEADDRAIRFPLIPADWSMLEEQEYDN